VERSSNHPGGSSAPNSAPNSPGSPKPTSGSGGATGVSSGSGIGAGVVQQALQSNGAPLRKTTAAERTFKLVHMYKPRSTLQFICGTDAGLLQWIGPIANELDQLCLKVDGRNRSANELMKLDENLQRMEARYVQKESELVQLRSVRDALFWERESLVLELQVREDNNVSQALTAVVVAFLSYLNVLVEMGENGRGYMVALAKCGFLVQQECLLSTHGKEKGGSLLT